MPPRSLSLLSRRSTMASVAIPESLPLISHWGPQRRQFRQQGHPNSSLLMDSTHSVRRWHMRSRVKLKGNYSAILNWMSSTRYHTRRCSSFHGSTIATSTGWATHSPTGLWVSISTIVRRRCFLLVECKLCFSFGGYRALIPLSTAI